MNGPNVLLIVMDTARASDAFRAGVMPNLRGIAAEGTTFTRAFTTGPWTLPSHASLFTGQYTTDHGTHAGSRRFEPNAPTLAERLRRNGYRTVGYSNNTWISSEFGFDRGFDDFYVAWELLEGGADLSTIAKRETGTLAQARAVVGELLNGDAPQTVVNALYAHVVRNRLLRNWYDDGAWLTNRRLERWLDRHEDDRPFFMFVNYLEPHLEYDPPRSFRDRFVPEGMDPTRLDDVNQDAWSYVTGETEMTERDFEALEALYAAELNYLDHRIGQLYDRLESIGELDDTVLIVVGDHGENIGEHGLMDHQYCLYDTLLHVPLVIRYPSSLPEGKVTDALVELRDLYPTVLEFADLQSEPANSVSDRSVATAPDEHRDRVIAEYVTPQPSMDALEERVGDLPPEVRRYDRGLRCIRTDQWKYIQGTDGSEELYDIVDDPGETDELSADREGVRNGLADTLTAEMGALNYEEEGDTDAATIEPSALDRLTDLGYL